MTITHDALALDMQGVVIVCPWCGLGLLCVW